MASFESVDYVETTTPVGHRLVSYEAESQTLYAKLKYGAGWRVEPHTHEWLAIMQINDGTGRVYDGDRWIDVGPGSVIVTPTGTRHGIEMTTDMELVEIYVGCSQEYFDKTNAGYWAGVRTGVEPVG